MANFTVVRQRVTSYSSAAALLPQLQQIYQQSQAVQAAINLYNAGTDADFNSAINSIFTAEERAQLATMLANLNTLVTAWANNHATLLGTNTEI
jgi:hypothetical protein